MPPFKALHGQVAYGIPVGLLMLDCRIPFVPGDVGNASSYDYPVLFETVRGASVDAVVNRGDDSIEAEVIRAAEHLVGQGVRAISSDCGYLGRYQAILAERLPVPVFVSSLLQVPLIRQMIGPNRELGILCASSDGVNSSLLESVGIAGFDGLVFRGLKDKTHFNEVMFQEIADLDQQRMEDEVVEVALEIRDENPNMGAYLLECSDLPPYGHAIQAATGLPVFDWIGFIDYVHHAVVRRPYVGDF